MGSPDALFHEAGEMFDYAAIELPGGVVGAYMEGGVLVVHVHASKGADPPVVSIRVDDEAVIAEPGKPKGRHRKDAQSQDPGTTAV